MSEATQTLVDTGVMGALLVISLLANAYQYMQATRERKEWAEERDARTKILNDLVNAQTVTNERITEVNNTLLKSVGNAKGIGG